MKRVKLRKSRDSARVRKFKAGLAATLSSMTDIAVEKLSPRSKQWRDKRLQDARKQDDEEK